ncbi:ATP-grasp domain-containing protein [Streptomyces sp. NPDC050560]|uniref:ATP-grasp domain-containing protein n=1 Tax=Streptomyces sp. NPDC050560 TaxID=3365630 RepID=UPI003793E795
MKTGQPAVLLVDPVQSGARYKPAARELGFSVVSLYTLDYPDAAAGEAGDDVSLHGTDPDEVARRIAARGLDIRAVVPAMEAGVHLSDVIADRLELPGNEHSLAWARRNKAAMRERAAAAGVRVPEFRVVHRRQDIGRAVEATGFPAIVKPTMGACSQGVVVLSDAGDLGVLDDLVTHDAFGAPVTEWLVERYVRGTEYALNFYSADGEHRLVDIWEYRQPDGRDYDFPVWDTLQLDDTHPRFERLLRFGRHALDAFGIRRGPSHTEVKCNDEEGVYLIELGARTPGGPATEMWGRHSDVIRPYHDSIECYLGRRPALMDEPLGFRARFGSVAIRNDEAPGTLKAVHGVAELAGLPGIDRVMVECAPGDRLPLTRDSLHIPVSVFVSGPDEGAVLSTLAAVRSLVTLDIEPDRAAARS